MCLALAETYTSITNTPNQVSEGHAVTGTVQSDRKVYVGNLQDEASPT